MASIWGSRDFECVFGIGDEVVEWGLVVNLVVDCGVRVVTVGGFV